MLVALTLYLSRALAWACWILIPLLLDWFNLILKKGGLSIPFSQIIYLFFNGGTKLFVPFLNFQVPNLNILKFRYQKNNLSY